MHVYLVISIFIQPLVAFKRIKGASTSVFPKHFTMVFRLPTTLEPFIPPPSQQVAEQRPWRGALVVSGMRPSDRSSAQTIRVTAVETDGEKFVPVLDHSFPPLIHYLAEQNCGRLSSLHTSLMDAPFFETCKPGSSGIRHLFAPSCLIVIVIPTSTR